MTWDVKELKSSDLVKNFTVYRRNFTTPFVKQCEDEFDRRYPVPAPEPMTLGKFLSPAEPMSVPPVAMRPRCEIVPVPEHELQFAGCHLPLTALERHEVCPACECLVRSHRNHPSNRKNA